MFELTINNEVYQFNFGIGFVREIDGTVTKEIDGVKGKVQNLGLQYAIAGIIDGDVITLADVLFRANKGYNPRITMKALEDYIEDESTDLDELFADVLGFFERANVTKKTTQALMKAIEDEKAKEAAKK